MLAGLARLNLLLAIAYEADMGVTSRRDLNIERTILGCRRMRDQSSMVQAQLHADRLDDHNHHVVGASVLAVGDEPPADTRA